MKINVIQCDNFRFKIYVLLEYYKIFIFIYLQFIKIKNKKKNRIHNIFLTDSIREIIY